MNPRVHHLRTVQPHYLGVASGDKTFDIRRNDRAFQTGDQLWLIEYDPAGRGTRGGLSFGLEPIERGDVTGHHIEATITYVLNADQHKGLRRRYVILGLAGRANHYSTDPAHLNLLRKLVGLPERSIAVGGPITAPGGWAAPSEALYGGD